MKWSGVLRIERTHEAEAGLPIDQVIWVRSCTVQFFFLKYVDPATYQILGNLKIVTTGLLLRVALNRHLSQLQWMALLLLTAGAATSQINTDCTAGTVQSVLHAPFMVSSAQRYWCAPSLHGSCVDALLG